MSAAIVRITRTLDNVLCFQHWERAGDKLLPALTVPRDWWFMLTRGSLAFQLKPGATVPPYLQAFATRMGQNVRGVVTISAPTQTATSPTEPV